MRSGIALSPQRRRRHPGRGDALGGFLSRRTRMLPVRKSGGPGKEVPPKRARTNHRKKKRSATAECLRKRGDLLRKNGSHLPRRRLKTMPMPLCVVGTTKQWEFFPFTVANVRILISRGDW